MQQVKMKSNSGSPKVLETDVTDSLASKLKGGIILPGDEGYEKARKVWNGMVDKRPGMIVRCRDTADVITAVNFAGEVKGAYGKNYERLRSIKRKYDPDNLFSGNSNIKA